MTGRVRKVFGPPGTGKTHRLLRIVEQEIRGGVPAEQIAFCSFTRRAIKEAVQRVCDELSLQEEQLPHFRTLHSVAFRAAAVGSDEMMGPEDYRELFLILGLTSAFHANFDENTGLPLGDSVPEVCIRIDALARLTLQEPADLFRLINPRNTSLTVVQQYASALRVFKEARGKLDFTDLLEMFDEELPVQVFVVDEAQDLSALQWRMARRAARAALRVYMAGDDDQAIYGWAGADARAFLAWNGEKEFLKQSHRLPRRAAALALDVVGRIRTREPKTFDPRAADGAIEHVREVEYIDLGGHDEWLLLARNGSKLGRYARLCRAQGRHYALRGQSSLDTPHYRAARAWERGRRGEQLRPKELKEIQRLLPTGITIEVRKPATLTEAGVPEGLRGLTWMEALPLMPAEEREYIRSVMAKGERASEAPRIRIETIHSAKGAQADNVALTMDISRRVWEQRDTDEERRVLYVGLTRVRERLVAVAPHTPRHYTL